MDFERLLEEFEERAVASPSEAFSFAAGQLFPGCGEAEILANPLIICEKLSFDSLYKLELQIQVLRYYRWKSKRFYGEIEANIEQKKRLCEMLERQDLVMLKSILSQISLRDPNILLGCKIVCSFINGVFMEMPQLIKRLMVVEGIAVECVPICIEYVPALHVLIDAIPELLKGLKHYGLEVVASLALKYPLAKVESHVPMIVARINEMLPTANGNDCIFLMAVVGKLCIAFPQSVDIHLKPLMKNVTDLAGDRNDGDGALVGLRSGEIQEALYSASAASNPFIYRRNITCLL